MPSFLLSALLAASLTPTADAPKPYGTVQKAGVWWFTDPQGKPFWSFGVCCVGPGETPKTFKEDNPGYAAYRLYPSTRKWAEATFGNLKSWGFNNLGGWSDYTTIQLHGQGVRMPYFEVLHLGAYDQAPWHDLFADRMRKAVRDAARDQIMKLKADPYLIGYFTDNELGWWDDTLFLHYFRMAPNTAGKKRMVKQVRDHYRTFDRFQKDWITNARSFDDLAKVTAPKLRPGGNGMCLINAWLGNMAEYYYAMVRDAIREHDKSRMIMGDRYLQYYTLPVVLAARKYVDVVSTNFGASWNDGTFSRFFLDTLHRATGKPVVITEFYMAANENRSGNKNFPPAFPVVQTQVERAAAYQRNVEGLASVPYVIGAHWFQYTDQPPQGRGDGENFNHGLVDTMGRPYEEMVAASRAADPQSKHRAARPTLKVAHAAPAVANPLAGLKAWDRQRGFIPSPEGLPFADLYASWDRDNLYLGLYAMDYFDETLYQGDQMPEAERSTWMVDLGRKKLTVRFGGERRKVLCSEPGIEIAETPDLRHTVLLKIPARLLGKTTLTAADAIQLRSTLATHSRGERMAWNAKVALTP